MKAVNIILSALMMLTLILPIAISADEVYVDNFVDEIGEINCPYGTPVIDANISTSEGWSEAQYIDKTNTDGCWGGEEVVITGNIYRAWDKTNLYIAADISIPEYTICTDVDDIEAHETGNRPGWNGDVFVYSVDPLQALLNEGFLKEAAPWYCFGLFEGGVIRTYRTHLNDGEITEQVAAKGALTETGWRFEVALPWEIICEDIHEFSFGDAALTPEIVAKAGSKISGSMIYYDRVFDPEQNGIITGSRYVTIAKTLPDGTPGISCSGWILDAHGMHFMLSGGPSDAETGDVGAAGGTGGSNAGASDTSAPNDTSPITEPVTDTNGNKVTDSNGQAVTQKTAQKATASQSSKPATGQSSAQTFDMSIAIALGALSASAIGIYAIKKRR